MPQGPKQKPKSRYDIALGKHAGGGGSSLDVPGELPRKGKKYHGAFHGDDEGRWELSGYLASGWRWNAAMSLSPKNLWKNISVKGATEGHTGFRKALREMVQAYPELRGFVVVFDGPYVTLTSLLVGTSET